MVGVLQFNPGKRAGCVALVAIKRRLQCKSRLAAALEHEARLELVRGMLDRVLSALDSAHTIQQYAVLSPERDILPADVLVLADAAEGLNAAVTHAYRSVLALGAGEVLILPADLPNVTGPEIDELVLAGRRGGFALAPDGEAVGTNALFLAHRGSFPFQFGDDSMRRHLAAATQLGLPECVVRLPGLAFDVDAPEHLRQIGQGACKDQLRA
jgi:2-phospho-L-lactate guanylyltransferase